MRGSTLAARHGDSGISSIPGSARRESGRNNLLSIHHHFNVHSHCTGPFLPYETPVWRSYTCHIITCYLNLSLWLIYAKNDFKLPSHFKYFVYWKPLNRFSFDNCVHRLCSEFLIVFYHKYYFHISSHFPLWSVMSYQISVPFVWFLKILIILLC